MNRILGTAGHVDHGKTTLIKALTGIDADRLLQEKSRGMTIDLGYAHMTLEKSGEVSLVDVPGHERYIKNMVAGASGIDGVIFVIAANEGVMPQTKEHVDICSCLGIKHGVIALNKCDLVEDSEIDDIVGNIRDTLHNTFLEDCSIIKVSAAKGINIDELKSEIDRMLLDINNEDAVENPEDFYMPIDRAFSVKGFGTVVTGSLLSGALKKAEECMLYPSMKKLIMRGLQVRNKDADYLSAHERCAVNLSDIGLSEVRRGDIIAPVDAYTPVMMLDIRIDMLLDAPFSVKSGDKFHVYIGTREYVAKVVLVDKSRLAAAECGYAQLRFTEKLIARIGEHIIIRNLSPACTIGGGVVIDNNPVKVKVGKITEEAFLIREKGNIEEQLLYRIKQHNRAFLKLNSINTFSVNDRLMKCDIDNTIAKLVEEGQCIVLPKDYIIDSVSEDNLWHYFCAMLSNYHRDYPTYPGMNLKEARFRLLGENYDSEAKALMDYWVDKEKIKIVKGTVSLYYYEEIPIEDDAVIRKMLIDMYVKAGIKPFSYNDVKLAFYNNKRFLPVLREILKSGELIKLDERYIVSKDVVVFAKEKLELMVPFVDDGRIYLGDYRDRLKCSRKVALAILEYFDSHGITKKVDDYRVLIE